MVFNACFGQNPYLCEPAPEGGNNDPAHFLRRDRPMVSMSGAGQRLKEPNMLRRYTWHFLGGLWALFKKETWHGKEFRAKNAESWRHIQISLVLGCGWTLFFCAIPAYDIGRKAASPKETRKTFTTMSRPVKTDLETHPQDIQTISESYVKTNANMFIKKDAGVNFSVNLILFRVHVSSCF